MEHGGVGRAARFVFAFAGAVLAFSAGCTHPKEPPPSSPLPPPPSPPPVERPNRYSIQGAVLDERQLPVPGAAVAIAHVSWATYFVDLAGEANREAVCDAEGRFSFADLAPGAYDVVAYTRDRAGYSAQFLSPSIRGQSPSRGEPPLHIWVAPFGSIGGTVCTATGEPLSGAKVGLAQRKEESGREAGNAQPIFAAPLYAVSGKDGHFELRYVVGKEVTLCAYYPGCGVGVSDWVSAGAKDVKIALSAGGGVAGTLVDGDTGKPVVEAQIVTHAPSPAHGMMTDTHFTKTDKEGKFHFQGLTPGIHEFQIPNADLALNAPPLGAVTVRGGEDVVANLSTRKSHHCSVSGRVFDGDSGKGLAGVAVGTAYPNERYAWTDADGHYTLQGLEEKEQRVNYIAPPGYPEEPHDGPRLFFGVGELSHVLDFELHTGRRILGQLVDHDGAPCSAGIVRGDSIATNPRAGVVVHLEKPTKGSHVSVDRDGHFALSGFGPGERVRLHAFRADQLESPDETLIQGGPAEVQLPEKGDLTGVKLTLRGGSYMRGIVLDATGAPVAGATVSITAANGQAACDPITSRPNGEFGTGKLPAGQYTIRAGASGMNPRPDTAVVIDLHWAEMREHFAVYVEPPADKKTEALPPQQPLSPAYLAPPALAAPPHAVALTPAPAAKPEEEEGLRIAGRVTDLKGAPLYKMEVMIDSNNPKLKPLNATTDPDGRYVIRGIPEGSYRVVVSSHEFEYTAKESIPAGSESVDFRLVRRGEPIQAGGVVIDAATRKPIPDFEAGPVDRPTGYAGHLKGVARWTRFQNPTGQFEITERVFVLAVHAAGYATRYIETPLPVRDLSVALDAERRVDGRIVDSSGSPVADAALQPVSRLRNMDGALKIESTAESLARSDAQGRFSITDLAGAELLVAAVHPNYAYTLCTLHPRLSADAAPGDSATTDIVLSKGGIVEGTVREGGKEIVNQNLRLYSAKLYVVNTTGEVTGADPKAKPIPFVRFAVNVQTDSKGHYSIPSFPLGAAVAELMETPPGGKTQASRTVYRDVTVEEGKTVAADLDIPTEFTTLEGRLMLKGQGRGGKVTVTVTGSGGSYRIGASAENSGVFRVPSVPCGKATIEASLRTSQNQMATQASVVELRPHEVCTKDINVEVAPLTVEVAGLHDDETALVAFIAGEETVKLDSSEEFQDLQFKAIMAGLTTNVNPHVPWVTEITPGKYTAFVCAWLRGPRGFEVGKNRWTSKVVEIGNEKTEIKLALP